MKEVQILSGGVGLQILILDDIGVGLGTRELIEAVYSVTENGENMRDSAAIGLSVAGSVATVLSR